MSSCPPTPCGSRRRVLGAVALLVSAVLLSLVGTPAAVAQSALVVVPTGGADGRMRLVVEVPEGAEPVRPETVAVSVDGAPAPAEVQPMLSDRLALGLVVDASAEGAALLPVGLGGAANLVLTVPPATRGTLVTDSTPPAIAVPWPSAQPVLLRGLSAVRPGGARNTAAALDLAVAQLPAGEDPRLVVLYTGARDAGGETAAAIAGRMRAAGVVLTVVSPSTGAPTGDTAQGFWAEAAEATGGLAVGTGPSEVIAAFDRAAAALGRRHLVTAAAPARLPATVAVRVGPLTGEAPLAAPPPEPPRQNRLVPVAAGAGVLAALVVLLVVVVRRIRRGAAPAGPSPAPPEPPRIWNVPPRLDDAVDRAGVIAELEAALQDGRPVWLRPHPDEAGLGLTTVLTEFAHRHRDRYDVAWWIPAMDPDLVADRMAELAEALGLAGPEDSADRAAAVLVEALRQRDRWLLVFDDAGGPRQLAAYLPDGPGDVLVSSSHAGWHDLAGPVEVRAFTRAESVSLLRRNSGLAAEPADRLAAALRDLPLAVGPAAAFLADTGASDLPDASDPESVWVAMLDRTERDDPQALALLTLVAWLGPAPVPLSLLVGNSEVLPEPLGTAARMPAGLREHAALLGRRGLARATSDDVALHPVPAALIIARTGHDHPGDDGWTAVAVRLLRAAAPDGPVTDAVSDTETRSAWRLLLPHVLAATDPARRLDPVAAEVGWLLRRAGEYLQARGRTHAAQALLDDARGFDGA
jgi:hypothetical protein